MVTGLYWFPPDLQGIPRVYQTTAINWGPFGALSGTVKILLFSELSSIMMMGLQLPVTH